MVIRKSFMLACAFCAVALLGAPRIARADFLQVDSTPYCYWRCQSSSSSPTTAVGIEQPVFASANGGSSSVTVSSGTNQTTTFEDSGFRYDYFICGISDTSVVDGSLPLSISIGYKVAGRFFPSGTRYLYFCPPSVSLHFLDDDTPNMYRYMGDIGNDYTITMWYCPSGLDSFVSSNWKQVNSNNPNVSFSDRFYTINEDVLAVCWRYRSKHSLSYYLPNWADYVSRYGLDAFRPGFLSLPQLFVDLPGTSVSLDGISVTVSNLNSDLTAQTGSLTNSISSQTSSINSNIDHEVQSQTSTMMDTTGASSVFSDQLSDAEDSLTQGVFGQIGDLESSVLSWSSDTSRNNTLRFPGIYVLGYELCPPRDVSIWVYGLSQFQEPVRAATTFVLFVLWLRGLYWIFYHQILGIDVNALGNAYKDD